MIVPSVCACRDELAIMTCLFSPQPHNRRRQNFEQSRLSFAHNLYVAEMVYGDSPWSITAGPQQFRFCGQSRHVLWQKERLLNSVIASLPEHIKYVAWVDADVLFVNPLWTSDAVQLLQRYPVVQLFDTVVYLDDFGFPESLAAGLISSFEAIGPSAFEGRTGASGFAWAARRDVLQAVGLLDVMVVGGADTYMACGFAGVQPETLFRQLSPCLRAYIEEWCRRAASVTKGAVGHLSGTVEHLFHGRLTTRGYLQRYEILRRAAFDPRTDIAITANGLYAWNSQKPRLHSDVAQYFERRAQAEND